MFLSTHRIYNNRKCALMQLPEPNWFKTSPVYYANWKLSTTERNCSTTERDALGMIYSVNKFRHYLLGRKFTFMLIILLYYTWYQNNP